ncbi:MAG TPA: hypothetical protein DIU35_09225 [Candidatus Latescibacteria bacterium]|nr:hypothetical protein [Gemmatimonadota bacterium]HCR17652.1 hypothetical protein [Candidatus Latescibacterota bacterium]
MSYISKIDCELHVHKHDSQANSDISVGFRSLTGSMARGPSVIAYRPDHYPFLSIAGYRLLQLSAGIGHMAPP